MGGGDNEVKPTADQNEQQKVNAELWNHYMQNYQPYIDKYVDKSLSNTDATEAAVAGATNAEVMKKLPRPNTNPVGNAVNMAKTTETASAVMERAAGKTKQRTIGTMANLVNIGRGQATQAVDGINAIANQSAASASGMADLEREKSANFANTVGSAVGAGTAIATRPKNRTLAYV